MEELFDYNGGYIEYEYLPSDKTIEIDLVWIDRDKRREGTGTAMLGSFFAFILATYDIFAVRLTVCSETVSWNEPGPTDEQLIAWYAKFGFTVYDYVECNERECARMVILPFEMENYLK